MGTLGCASEYVVIAIEEIVNMNVLTGQAQFGRPVGELSGFSQLVWDRRLDDTSEAVLTIPTNADCCTSGFLNDLHSWHHGIAIYRNGELVWDGPIIRIEATRTEATITAHDISALLSKRLLPRDLCFSNDPLVCTAGSGGVVLGPHSPEFVATALVQEALAIDGHGGFVSADLTRPELYEGSYKRYGGPVFDLLQKLASEFVNWTVLGRRFVIAHGGVRDAEGTGFARTALLTCDDFINDTFKVIEDGLATLTQDVQILAPVVTNGTEESSIGIGQIFAVGNVADAYYGLLQGIQQGNENLNIGGSAGQALAAAAVNIVRGAYPPPIVLSADGLRLSPNAPVTISELVPGTFIPVLADCLCRPVQQEFVLSKLQVTWNTEGEVVEPTFISIGSDNASASE